MPKNENTTGLFACVNPKEPELAISVPINYSAKKEPERLALYSRLSGKEMKVIEEIKVKIPIIEKREKTKKEEFLLKLMLNIKKTFTEIECLKAIESLKQMIAIYVEERYVEESNKIDSKQYESEPLARLVLPELNQDAKKQEIQVKPLPSSDVELIDQLKEIVATRRVLIDEQTINTKHTQKNKKKSEDQKTELTEKSEEGKFINPTAVEVLKQKKIEPNQIKNSKSSKLKNIESELLNILTQRKKISEGTIENNEKSEEEKSSNPTAVEGQFMQKNVDIDLKQNSDEDSFLLQQIKAARKQRTNNQTTVQEDNLPSWVKSEFIDSASEKTLLEEKKEQALFNFSEIVCNTKDLSDEERQEIINFHEQVYNVKLRPGNEAGKERFENTVSKIIEISRPNSILDDEFSNNLKTINDFIKENDTQQQSRTPVSLQFKLHNKHEPVTAEMIPKPNFK